MIKMTRLTLMLFLLSVGFVPMLSDAEPQKGEPMDTLSVFINGSRGALSPPPLQQNGAWLVPLESFSKLIDAKVEYPEGSGMAVVCQADRCVPLKLGDRVSGAIEIDGLAYALPEVIAEPFGFQIQTQSPNRIDIVKGGVQMTEKGNTAGWLAPDFVLPDLNGKPRRLSDFRGKKTLIYMWGSW
ncbi:MAG: hypothetical protein O7E52_22090 [Candidatus Poribacteria bacterium]|nr:hypothetical protein [Candidatus Poribacteria bacterium]